MYLDYTPSVSNKMLQRRPCSAAHMVTLNAARSPAERERWASDFGTYR